MQPMLPQTPVIIASEHAQVRTVLRRFAQHQAGVTVAGEAGNELATVALARDVKPRVALIDYRLPYFQGLEGNPLSRIDGLNTARAIAEEVGGATAVLVTNADSEMHLSEVLDAGAIPYLKLRRGMDSALVPLRHLADVVALPRVVFAELAVHHPEAVDVRPRATIWERVAGLSGLLTTLGVIFVGAGLGLLLSVVFAGPGAIMLMAGVAGLAVGMGGLRLSKFGTRGQRNSEPVWEAGLGSQGHTP